MTIKDLSEILKALPMDFSEEACTEISKTFLKVARLHEEGCSINQMKEILKTSEKNVKSYSGYTGSFRKVNVIFIDKTYFNYMIEDSETNKIDYDEADFVLSISVMDKETNETILLANLNMVEIE